MPRVLMISDVYFPRVNGVSTSIETFRRALGAVGMQVRLLVPRYGDEAAQSGIVRVPGRSLPFDPEDRLISLSALRRAALNEAAQADLIHIQTPFAAHYAGLAAARARGLPVMLTYHTFFEEYLHHYLPFIPAFALRALARRISRSQCNAVDQVVVPSTAMRDRLRDYGVSAPICVLPTGIPVRALAGGDGAAFRQAFSIPVEARVGLYVGRVAHEKNLRFLLDVAACVRQQLAGFVLVIAGEGPALPELQRRVRELGLSEVVRFVGYLDREHALPACYAAADVFMFASRTETQGLVLLEAMAAGLPVVALAEMGAADILRGEQGARIAPDDARGFAAVVGQVLSDPALQAQLADSAREHALRWGDEEMAARLAALYRRLSGGQRGRN